MRGNHFLFLLSIVLVSLGCAAPKYTYLPAPSGFSKHVKGLYFEAELRNDSLVTGEIIAVENERMLLLGLDSIPDIIYLERDSVTKGNILVCHTSEDAKKIRKFATLVPFLTLGHGGWAIITLPGNVIATASIANSATNGPYRIVYPAGISWNQIAKFARFPTGIPDEVPVDAIR